MTLKNRSIRAIILIWIAWAVIIIGYQTLASERIPPQRPDYSRDWTPDYTLEDSLEGHIYLTEPFMNRQVAYDSEYYLSIAVAGYEDTNAPFTRTRGGTRLPLNYAFFPFYPTMMGILSTPLSVLGMNPIATATLAGVLLSLGGTLAGMISLYLLTRDALEDAGGIRTAFYLIIFPSGFFLTQVYTEGLFVGLAFTSLALIRHKRLLLAGILAALAVWTRAVGLALFIPLALAWLSTVDWRAVRQQGRAALPPIRTLLLNLLAVLLPIGAYLVWQRVLGRPFNQVEELWFGRRLFDFSGTLYGWETAINAIIDSSNPQMRVYFLLELGAVLLALVACLATIRRYPGIALFGLLALAVSFFSGAPQSLIRYVLVIPSVYLFLSQLGRHTAFDRAWTIASVLLMGLLVYLYSFDLWVA